jgi:3-hydroxyisobutyrate dehydrogenase-like beta-hydroxyacid dehydrogenase
MAKNLVAAEFDVLVFDLDAARMAGLPKVGARIASTLTELAADVDVLMTSLPGATSGSSFIFSKGEFT